MIFRAWLKKGFPADRTDYKLEGKESILQITHLPDNLAPQKDLKPTPPVTLPLCGFRESSCDGLRAWWLQTWRKQ